MLIQRQGTLCPRCRGKRCIAVYDFAAENTRLTIIEDVQANVSVAVDVWMYWGRRQEDHLLNRCHQVWARSCSWPYTGQVLHSGRHQHWNPAADG